jgi:hypothetical protein
MVCRPRRCGTSASTRSTYTAGPSASGGRDLRAEATKPIVDEAARYVLVTSARLTRHNKQEIVGIFAGRISPGDVLARDNLTALLRRHPEVERANVKLWLTSGAVLQTLLHQIEHLRSAALKSDLLRLQSTFVETSIVTKARQVIEQFGVCVLAGPPGVGKTTTGLILLLQYLAEGWRPITAVAHVRELEAQLAPSRAGSKLATRRAALPSTGRTTTLASPARN